MPNRKLDLEKFLDAIPRELLTQYFNKKAQENGRETLTTSLVTRDVISYLDLPDDLEIKDDIRQDFIQINDLCERSMGFLIDEVNKRRIPINEKESQEELGMRMFLQYKDVFEYAHDRYYYLHSSGKISEHNISAEDSDISDDQKRLFNEKVRGYFAKLAKGGNSIIRHHKKDDRLMIAIVHGSYKRALSSWENDEMKDTRTILYRPAKEDILEYVYPEQKLYIKASSGKDREFYISAFTEEIVGDKEEAVRDDRDDTFDLSILQNQDFRFELDETIQAVYLLEVRVSMSSVRKPDWVFRSSDVLASLKEEVRGLRLNNGIVEHSRFLFRLNIDGKSKKVTFEITPPNATNLNKKKYARIIRQYLERIGIKKSAQTTVGTVVEDAESLVQ